MHFSSEPQFVIHSTEVIAEVLNQRKIMGFWWPFHHGDVFLLKVLLANSCHVGFCIVVLKCSHVWRSHHEWVDYFVQNVQNFSSYFTMYGWPVDHRQYVVHQYQVNIFLINLLISCQTIAFLFFNWVNITQTVQNIIYLRHFGDLSASHCQ